MNLSVALSDLPPGAQAEIMEIISAYTLPGTPCVGVLIFNLKGAGAMGEITVKADEANLRATVTALDAEGNPTTFDDPPTWESSDESVAVVTPSEDGYSATFAIGDPGSAVITVTGIENSSGEDVDIVSTGLINVTAADAVVGSVEFSNTVVNPLE